MLEIWRGRDNLPPTPMVGTAMEFDETAPAEPWRTRIMLAYSSVRSETIRREISRRQGTRDGRNSDFGYGVRESKTELADAIAR